MDRHKEMHSITINQAPFKLTNVQLERKHKSNGPLLNLYSLLASNKWQKATCELWVPRQVKSYVVKYC